MPDDLFDDFGIPGSRSVADPVPQLPRRSTAKTPFEDPTNWAAPIFGANRAPGKWKITGERLRRIDQPEKKGKNNDALIDQGIARGEVYFECETFTGQHYRDLHDFCDQYLSPDRPLTKANVTMIAYPALYVRGVTQVYGFKASFPVPRSDKGDSPMISTFSAKVFNAGTRIGGEGGSRKPKPANGTNTNAGSATLQQFLDAVRLDVFKGSGRIITSPDAQALANRAGVNAEFFTPGPVVPVAPVLLPASELASLASVTRSVPDQMVVDMVNARAPR